MPLGEEPPRENGVGEKKSIQDMVETLVKEKEAVAQWNAKSQEIETKINQIRKEISNTNDRLSSLPVATPVSKEDLKALHGSLKTTRAIAEQTEKCFQAWAAEPTFQESDDGQRDAYDALRLAFEVEVKNLQAITKRIADEIRWRKSQSAPKADAPKLTVAADLEGGNLPRSKRQVPLRPLRESAPPAPVFSSNEGGARKQVKNATQMRDVCEDPSMDVTIETLAAGNNKGRKPNALRDRLFKYLVLFVFATITYMLWSHARYLVKTAILPDMDQTIHATEVLENDEIHMPKPGTAAHSTAEEEAADEAEHAKDQMKRHGKDSVGDGFHHPKGGGVHGGAADAGHGLGHAGGEEGGFDQGGHSHEEEDDEDDDEEDDGDGAAHLDDIDKPAAPPAPGSRPTR